MPEAAYVNITHRTLPAIAGFRAQPIDILQTRVVQARASADALLVHYSMQKPDEMAHQLSPRAMLNALWGILELLDQACEASDEYTAQELI